jgi:Protein tyrosine and serine/threonine kinase
VGPGYTYYCFSPVSLAAPLLAFLVVFCTKLITEKWCKSNVHSTMVYPKLYNDDEIVNDYYVSIFNVIHYLSINLREIVEITFFKENPSPPYIETNVDMDGYIVMEDYGKEYQPVSNFPLRHLDFDHTIGEGVFGKVVFAKAENLTGPGVTTQVAVKMLNVNHTDSEIKDLQRELEIMQSVGYHKNIVNLLGCSYDAKKKLMIIMDYTVYGNLRNHLHTHNKVSQGDLCKFALQVATGMMYLATKQVINSVILNSIFNARPIDFFESVLTVTWRPAMCW